MFRLNSGIFKLGQWNLNLNSSESEPQIVELQKSFHMIRFNSGIFRIFDPREWNLNLKSSDCRASKIVSNDTKLQPISWYLKIENRLFNFCVGVGGFEQKFQKWILRELDKNFDILRISKIPGSSSNFFNSKNKSEKKLWWFLVPEFNLFMFLKLRNSIILIFTDTVAYRLIRGFSV